METIVDNLELLARRCERAVLQYDDSPNQAAKRQLSMEADRLEKAWSGSFIGYHAHVYTADLQPKQPGQHFDSTWGSGGLGDTRGSWAEYDFESLYRATLASIDLNDLSPFDNDSRGVRDQFDEVIDDLLPMLDAFLSHNEDDTVTKLRDEATAIPHDLPRSKSRRSLIPGGEYGTADSRAIQGGIQLPVHLAIRADIIAFESAAHQLSKLGKLIRRMKRYLEHSLSMKGNTVAKTSGTVFIGHGRSAAWKQLKDFLNDRLGLSWDEYNRDPTAGLSRKEVLESKLDSAVFAFLVMTAEDAHSDGTRHARENVVHEAGLFQGRLGFHRAIVMLEEGCEEFSNINGLDQIRFPAGNIVAQTEEIRRVLEREGLLPST